MPTGPKVIGNAVKIMRIATGEDADGTIDDGKDPAAREPVIA